MGVIPLPTIRLPILARAGGVDRFVERLLERLDRDDRSVNIESLEAAELFIGRRIPRRPIKCAPNA